MRATLLVLWLIVLAGCADPHGTEESDASGSSDETAPLEDTTAASPTSTGLPSNATEDPAAAEGSAWHAGLEACSFAWSLTFVDREALQALVPSPLRVRQYGPLGVTPTGGAFLIQASCPSPARDLGFTLSAVLLETPAADPPDAEAFFVLRSLAGDQATAEDFAGRGLATTVATGQLELTPFGSTYSVEGSRANYTQSGVAGYERSCGTSGACDVVEAFYFSTNTGLGDMRLRVQVGEVFDGTSQWNVPTSDPLAEFETPTGDFRGVVIAMPKANLRLEP